MHVKNGILGAALMGLTVVISAQGQAPAQPPAGGGAQPPAAPAGQGEGRGRGTVQAPAPGRGGGRLATFPAGQRPPDDPAVVARGKVLYEANCRLCHGADLRGGEGGGPNLLRSIDALHDQNGERLIPLIRAGMPPRMPPSTLAQDELHAISIYIHAIQATMTGQGGPPRGNPMPTAAQVLVGNVEAGRQYFAAKCATCHSVTGDMAGIGGRITDPRQLQNAWVGGTVGGGGGRGGGGGGGRGGRGGPTVTVTLPNGQKFEGTPGRLDEFVVVVRMADGSERSFPRNGDVPKVDVKDPRQPHRDMMPELLDRDMHNVTAFLASLK
jgi:cytochrome c oxidase cbb3-type subunit 3